MAPTTSRPWPPPSTADRARRSVGERLPRLSTPCCDPVRLVLRRPIESGQYASKPYRAVLARHGITQSMSRKGDCYGRVGGWRGGFAPRWGYGVAFAPPPQSGSAGLRLQPPLVEPEVRISRIRLPLEISGLRARRVDVRSRQLVQAEGLVEVGPGIAAVSRPLSAAPARQPALQPPFGVPAGQIVDPRDRPLVEVGGPAPQERVERRDPTFGRGRVPPARRQVVDPSQQAPDRLLGRGGAEIRPAALPVEPADRVAEAVEALLGQHGEPGLAVVPRQPEPHHQVPHGPHRCLARAGPAADDEVVGVVDDVGVEPALPAQLLPGQDEAAEGTGSPTGAKPLHPQPCKVRSPPG